MPSSARKHSWRLGVLAGLAFALTWAMVTGRLRGQTGLDWLEGDAESESGYLEPIEPPPPRVPDPEAMEWPALSDREGAGTGSGNGTEIGIGAEIEPGTGLPRLGFSRSENRPPALLFPPETEDEGWDDGGSGREEGGESSSRSRSAGTPEAEAESGWISAAERLAERLEEEGNRRAQPIDLPNALRLAGARSPQIAMARARVAEALANRQLARSRWLPSLYAGLNWNRHDGWLQDVGGRMFEASKSSGFLGLMGASGLSATGPNPAAGVGQTNGIQMILRVSDAIFEPLAASRRVDADVAGERATTNETLLGVAESYLELQRAAGAWSIAAEALGRARELAAITRSYREAGSGLEADASRAMVEVSRFEAAVEAAAGAVFAASAELGRRLRLDPMVVAAPIEPPDTLLSLFPATLPLDGLIELAMGNRPEVARAAALASEADARRAQAGLRPLLPSVALRGGGGGFAGGINDQFRGGIRSDVDVSVYWQLEHMGLGDRARRRAEEARLDRAILELTATRDRVAAEVSAADADRRAALKRVARLEVGVGEAERSLELNLAGLRAGAGLAGSPRPIEALQPIEALARMRREYLDGILDANRAQFRLQHALGYPAEPGIGAGAGDVGGRAATSIEVAD